MSDVEATYGYHPNHDRSETAELRDRLIVAETRAILLEDMLMHPSWRRGMPVREIRKDAGAYRAAKSETTQRLMRVVGRVG